ncbi:MAG: molybdopterin converting factor subunit 1 [Anaerolineales bacterium]
MQIDVLYFATLRDLVGLRKEQLSLPELSTVGDLKDRLSERGDRLALALGSALFSVNHEFAFPEERLEQGDEVGVFPPVSGGAHPTILKVTEEPLDLNELIDSIAGASTGAVCIFSGLVRAQTERGEPHLTSFLEYEAYWPMAEAKLGQVAGEMRERWPEVEGIALVQRVGHLDPATPTAVIACSGPHRDSGIFEAARYGIDRLKQIVPIWKKEVGPDGESWVEGTYQPQAGDQSS